MLELGRGTASNQQNHNRTGVLAMPLAVPPLSDTPWEPDRHHRGWQPLEKSNFYNRDAERFPKEQSQLWGRA